MRLCSVFSILPLFFVMILCLLIKKVTGLHVLSLLSSTGVAEVTAHKNRDFSTQGSGNVNANAHSPSFCFIE